MDEPRESQAAAAARLLRERVADLERAVESAHALVAHWRLRQKPFRLLAADLIADVLETVCFELEAVLPPKVETRPQGAQTPPVVAGTPQEGVRTGSSPEGPQVEPCPGSGEAVKGEP